MPKYSVQYKKKVVAYYKKNGQAKTIKKFGHSHSVIHKWLRKSETVGFMRKKNRTYTRLEKLEIINHYFKNGSVDTSRKYDIDQSVFMRWERILREYGEEGLEWDGRGRKIDHLGPKKDLNTDKDLLRENQRLRPELEYLKKLDALVQEREEREKKKK